MSDLRQLEFKQTADLIDAIKWVSLSTTKVVGVGDAREYTNVTLLEQNSAGVQLAEVIEYNNGNAWLGRYCECSGVLPGTQYLLDGKKIKSSLGNKSTQSKSPLVFVPTELNTVKVYRVNTHNRNDIKAGSCIEVDTYPGDLEDFKMPNDPSILVASIDDGFHFKRMASYNISCSFKKEGSSSSTTEAQKVFLLIDNGRVTITSLEKNGKRGHLIATTSTKSFVRKPISIIFEGIYLRKAVDVFNQNSSEIRIYVDDLENPTRVNFMGAGGFTNLQLVDLNSPALRDSFSVFTLCNYIQGFSKSHNLDVEIKTETVSEYVFDLEYFLSEFSTQLPIKTKKKNEADDMVLEMVDNTMHIYKKANVEKRQLAVIPTERLTNQGEWLKCQIKFPHMHDALKALLNYVKKEEQYSSEFFKPQYSPDLTEIDDDEEGEEYDFLDFEDNYDLKSNETTHSFILRQSKRTIADSNVVYDLFLESPDYKDFKVRIWMNVLN